MNSKHSQANFPQSENKLSKLRRVYRDEQFAGILRRVQHVLGRRFPGLINRAWLKQHTPTAEDLQRMSRVAFHYSPTISIVLPVYNPKPNFLRACLDSVLEQVYKNWELCIADDASTNPAIKRILEEYAAKDDRIKVVFRKKNGHISAASNSALKVAKGQFVALLDHDDALAPHALFEVVSELNKNSDVDLLYSNEDKLTESGRRCAPTFKSQWSPEYFLSFMYIGHLSVYRKSIVDKVGGFREGFEGSQDYDLALRVTEKTNRVRHIPKILYHWRMHADSVAGNLEAKPYAFKVAQKALTEALERRGIGDAKAEPGEAMGLYQPRVRLVQQPLVSVLFPLDAGNEARVRMVKDRTDYSAIEYICLDAVQKSTALDPNFFYAALEASEAPYICILRGGVKPRSKDWLTRLLECLALPDVGVVGAKVYSGTGRIVHAGYSLIGSRIGHNFFGAPDSDPGYAARLIANHNVSAVSSYCLLVEREVLAQALSGIRKFAQPECFDIHLSLTAAKLGKRVLWTPHSEVDISEVPQQRLDISKHPGDFEQLEKCHRVSTYTDPYYPEGLDTKTMDFRIAV